MIFKYISKYKISKSFLKNQYCKGLITQMLISFIYLEFYTFKSLVILHISIFLLKS
jgi:hypothetical protein